MTEEIITIRQKAQAAITDPFAPPPSVDELAAMYGANNLPTFEEYKLRFLKNAPPAVVNFYKNLRTPRGAEKFMRLMLWYPEILQSLVEQSKTFVPFILPSDEIEISFDWAQKRRAAQEQIFDKAMKAYLDITTIQTNKQQLLANSMVERVSNITDPTDWVRAWKESTIFWGTPFAPTIHGAFILSGVKILRQNPTEETKNLMRATVPPEIWHAIETQASNLQRFQDFSISMIQSSVAAAEKWRNTLGALNIQVPELDAAIEMGRKAVEFLQQVPREELPTIANQALTHLDRAITRAMTIANTKVSKGIGDLVTAVRQLLAQVGSGTIQAVNNSLTQFRSFVGHLGGRIGQVMGDDKGIVTFNSWRSILEEVNKALDNLIEVGEETGAYFVEPLRILKSMANGKLALLDFSEGLYNNLKQTMKHPDFLKLPPKAELLELEKKTKSVNLQRAIINLRRAMLSLQDLKDKVANDKFKFKFDVLHRYFNDTRQLLAALKSAGITRVVKTEDGKKLLKDALAMTRNLAAPGVEKILGPEIAQRLRHDVIDKDIKHALEILDKPSNQIKPQDAEFIDGLVNTILLELANAHDAMKQFLMQQGVLPTTQSLPPDYNFFGGVPQQFGGAGEGRGIDPTTQAAIQYLLVKELQRQIEGEQAGAITPPPSTKQTGRSSEKPPQIVVTPEEVVFGTKFGKKEPTKKEPTKKEEPKKEPTKKQTAPPPKKEETKKQTSTPPKKEETKSSRTTMPSLIPPSPPGPPP